MKYAILPHVWAISEEYMSLSKSKHENEIIIPKFSKNDHALSKQIQEVVSAKKIYDILILCNNQTNLQDVIDFVIDTQTQT